jgi:AraC family transcriptional regulator
LHDTGLAMQTTHSNPIDKALWYIESHFSAELSLEEVAQAAGVSRFHLTRAFGVSTGRSIMRYVRARRLGEAARKLAKGAPDILGIALEWGYGSHEAFTRAFRDEFGITPEELRARGDIASLDIMEPIRMNATHDNPIDPPRFVDGPAFLVAGLSERYSYETCAGIPAQWQSVQPYLGRVPGQKGTVAYGVCYNNDDSGHIDYMSGVEVEDLGRTPKELARLRIPAQRYAVFTHKGHITTIRGTWKAIFCDWIPTSGCETVDAPSFERYDERFDPHTGNGELEIWLPIRGKA